MPNPEIDRLSPDSGNAQKQAAISACIAQEVSKGTPQDQAVAMCNSMASEKMGRGTQ